MFEAPVRRDDAAGRDHVCAQWRHVCASTEQSLRPKGVQLEHPKIMLQRTMSNSQDIYCTKDVLLPKDHAV
jgi:hypothetical protein